MQKQSNLSVAIITFNEADRLPDCIASVSFAEDIVVVDSGSTDDTAAVARELGCRFVHQPFLGFGRQKQCAVDKCRNDWVLILDADERLGKGGAGHSGASHYSATPECSGIFAGAQKLPARPLDPP